MHLLRLHRTFELYPCEAETVWHVAAYLGNLKVLEKLWEWAKEKLSEEENKKLLLATDMFGRTGWHLAAVWSELGILEKVWKCAEEKLTAEEIHKLLLATDNEGRTA